MYALLLVMLGSYMLWSLWLGIVPTILLSSIVTVIIIASMGVAFVMSFDEIINKIMNNRQYPSVVRARIQESVHRKNQGN